MSAKSSNRLIDHLMSGLEDIIGIAGKHSIREKLNNLFLVLKYLNYSKLIKL